MQDFKLLGEFPPGVFIGAVGVEFEGRVEMIFAPELEATWTLHTDGFADLRTEPEQYVERFSRSAAGMRNPIPCWTRVHVENFVRREML